MYYAHGQGKEKRWPSVPQMAHVNGRRGATSPW